MYFDPAWDQVLDGTMLSPERASVLNPAIFIKSRLDTPPALFLDIAPLFFFISEPPFLSNLYYHKIKLEKTVGYKGL
jgi:hypothetical protein